MSRPIRHRLQSRLTIVLGAGIVYHHDFPAQSRVAEALNDGTHVFPKMTGISVAGYDEAEVDF